MFLNIKKLKISLISLTFLSVLNSSAVTLLEQIATYIKDLEVELFKTKVFVPEDKKFIDAFKMNKGGGIETLGNATKEEIEAFDKCCEKINVNNEDKRKLHMFCAPMMIQEIFKGDNDINKKKNDGIFAEFFKSKSLKQKDLNGRKDANGFELVLIPVNKGDQYAKIDQNNNINAALFDPYSKSSNKIYINAIRNVITDIIESDPATLKYLAPEGSSELDANSIALNGKDPISKLYICLGSLRLNNENGASCGLLPESALNNSLKTIKEAVSKSKAGLDDAVEKSEKFFKDINGNVIKIFALNCLMGLVSIIAAVVVPDFSQAKQLDPLVFKRGLGGIAKLFFKHLLQDAPTILVLKVFVFGAVVCSLLCMAFSSRKYAAGSTCMILMLCVGALRLFAGLDDFLE